MHMIAPHFMSTLYFSSFRTIQSVKVKVSDIRSWLCPTLCDPMTVDCHAPLNPQNSPGKNTGVGRHSLLQEIFPTQGQNLGLLYCRQILYCLRYQDLEDKEELDMLSKNVPKVFNGILLLEKGL